MSRVLLLFVDGLGIGDPDPARNPFLQAQLPALRQLWGGQPGVKTVPDKDSPRPDSVSGPSSPTFAGEAGSPLSRGLGAVFATDATLGVPGFPQSATGQVTIFTGQNAALLMGEHIHGRPTGTLAELLRRDNIYLRAMAHGRRATFLNAYRPEFFQFLETEPDLFSAKIYRPSATTLAAASAGLPFRTFADLAAGRAVYQDITHWTLQGRYPIDPVTPAEAGRRAARLAREFDLSVFEHFWTDRAGHSGQMETAVRILEILDGFLAGVLEEIDLQSSVLILTSDHGNIEDLSTLTHTRNPVPTIVAGPEEVIPDEVRDLTHIAPLIYRGLALDN